MRADRGLQGRVAIALVDREKPFMPLIVWVDTAGATALVRALRAVRQDMARLARSGTLSAVRAERVLLILAGLMLAAAMSWSTHVTLRTRYTSRETRLSPDGSLILRETPQGTILHFPSTGFGFTVHRWENELDLLAIDLSSPGLIAWREDGAIWAAEIEKEYLADPVRMRCDLTTPTSVRVSPDGASVAVCYEAQHQLQTIVVFDRKAGSELWRMDVPAWSTSVAWSPDSRILVTLSSVLKNLPLLRVCDGAVGTLLAEDESFWSNWSDELFFVPGSRILWTRINERGYSQTPGPPFIGYDLADPSLPREFRMADAPFFRGATISPSGLHVAASKPGDPARTYTIWKHANGRFERIAEAAFGWRSEIADVAFVSDDRQLLIAHGTGEVESYDLATGKISLVTTYLRDPPIRRWQLWLWFGCLLWLCCWLIHARRKRVRTQGTGNGFDSTFVAAAATFVVGIISHAAGLVARDAEFNQMRLCSFVVMLLAACALTMIAYAIYARRPVVALFGLGGVATLSASFATTLVAMITSV